MTNPVVESLYVTGAENTLSGVASLRDMNHRAPLHQVALKERLGLGVGEGDEILVVFKLQHVASAEGERDISDEAGFRELTGLGLWRVSKKSRSSGGGVYDFEFGPAASARWAAKGLEAPTKPGVALRVFDGPTHDYDGSNRLSVGIATAQDGDLLWELGFTGAGELPAEGEGLRVKPACGDNLRNGRERFLHNSAIQAGLNVITTGGAAAQLQLLPTGDLFGAPTAFQAELSGWLPFGVGQWHTLSNGVSVQVRPQFVRRPRVWLTPSHVPPGGVQEVELRGANLPPHKVLAANSILVDGAACTHSEVTIDSDGQVGPVQLSVPALAEGRHGLTLGKHEEAHALAALPAGAPSAWTPFNEGLDSQSILGLAVHPTNHKMIVVILPDGVYRSTDAGATWAKGGPGEGLPASQGVVWGHMVSNSLFVHPGRGSEERLYAVVNGIVFVSDDFGARWEERLGAFPAWTRMPHGSGVCVDTLAGVAGDPERADGVLAGTIQANGGGGLLGTNDAGLTWKVVIGSRPCRDPGTTARRSVASGYPTQGDPRYRSEVRTTSQTPPIDNDAWPIAIDPRDASLVFVSGHYPRDFVRSTDGGASWEVIEDMAHLRVSAILAHPRDPQRWYASGEGQVWESWDRGQTWARSEEAPAHVNAFVSDELGVMWALTASGVFWSRGRRWRQVAWKGVEPLAPKNLVVRYPLYPIPTPTLYLGTHGQGLYVKPFRREWQKVTVPTKSMPGVWDVRWFDDRKFMVAAMQGDGLYRRSPGDPAWRRFGPPTPRLSSFDLTPDHTSVFIASGGLLEWDGRAPTWSRIDLTIPGVPWHQVSGVRVHPTIEGRVAVLAGFRNVHWVVVLQRAQGAWQVVRVKELRTSLCVALTWRLGAGDEPALYVFGTGQIFRSRSGGELDDWDVLSGLNPSEYAFGVTAPDPAVPGRLTITAGDFGAQTDAEVYSAVRSFQEGEPWVRLTPAALELPDGTSAEFGAMYADVLTSQGDGLVVHDEMDWEGSGPKTGIVKYRHDVSLPWRALDESGLDPWVAFPNQVVEWDEWTVLLTTWSQGIFRRSIP